MPKVTVFYHYFHPDDVVSAQIYADLCIGLQERGWDVTVMPCDRDYSENPRDLPPREIWKGIKIKRVWRPPFLQNSTLGRILNSIWMLVAWSLAGLFHRPDAIIIGTDPIFSVLVVLPWKLLHPSTRILHWCFDLYPEAAVVAKVVAEQGLFLRILKPILRWAYRRCDVIGSLGCFMTRRLQSYGPHLNIQELTPWALSEPTEPLKTNLVERTKVFGDVSLALMYSGTFGRAHSYEELLCLARVLRGRDVVFAFGVRGNRVEELKAAITEDDSNICFTDFAPQSQLVQRLSAADIQIVTLRSEFSGIVVPSKFQGALAIGRPILFAGDPESDLGHWIRKYGLGWCLTTDNIPEVAEDLARFGADPMRMAELRNRCFQTYQEQFSKAAVISRVHNLLLPVALRSLRLSNWAAQ